MVEHSGHMVPEGGYGMIPRYVFDGCLIAGETAGLCMNMGYQVRGMDFAVASGRMAAEAAVAAIDAGDTSAAGLAPYKAAMEGSFVIQDLRTFSKWPHVMEEWGSMFTDYPVMVKEVFNAMFSVDGAPQRPLMKRMGPIIKKRGVLKLGREVMKGGERRCEQGCEITVNVDEALSVSKYEVDEETPHIELAEDDGSEAYDEEFLKLVRVCPAALYKVDGTARSRSTTPAAWSAAPAASPARAPSSRSGSTPARRWASSTAWASIGSAPERRLGPIARPGARLRGISARTRFSGCSAPQERRTFGSSLSLRSGRFRFVANV